jgi:hypothetical protein
MQTSNSQSVYVRNASFAVPILAWKVDLPLVERLYNWSGGKSVTVFDSTVTDSWYFWSWTDLNGNGFPDWYEVNPTPVNHGK